MEDLNKTERLDTKEKNIGKIFSVTGEEKKYRYLGELLERWQMDNIDARDVLSFLSTHRHLIMADSHSINSDQMEKFINSMQNFLLQDDILYSALKVGTYFYTILVFEPERLTECLEKYVQSRGSIGCEFGYLLTKDNRDTTLLNQLTSKKSSIRKQIVKMLDDYQFDFNRNTKDTVKYFKQTIEFIKLLKLSKNEFKNEKKFESLKNILYLGRDKINHIPDDKLVEIFEDCFLISDYGFYLHRELIPHCYSENSKKRYDVQNNADELLKRNVYINSDIFKQCYSKEGCVPIIFGKKAEDLVNCHFKEQMHKAANEVWSFEEISRTLDILKKYHVFSYKCLSTNGMLKFMDFSLIEKLEKDCYEYTLSCSDPYIYSSIVDNIFSGSETYIYHMDFLTRTYEHCLELNIRLRNRLKAVLTIFGVGNKDKQISFNRYQDFVEIFDYCWDDFVVEKILQTPYLKEKYIMFLKTSEGFATIIHLKEKTVKNIFSFFNAREQNFLFVNGIRKLGNYTRIKTESFIKKIEFSDFKKPTNLVSLSYLINDFDTYVTNEKLVKLALEEQTIIVCQYDSIYKPFLRLLSNKKNLDTLCNLYGKQYVFEKISDLENSTIKMDYLEFLNMIYSDEELMNHCGYSYQMFNDYIMKNKIIHDSSIEFELSYYPVLDNLRRKYMSGGSAIYEKIMNESSYLWRHFIDEILNEIQSNQEKFSEQQMLFLKQKIIQRCFFKNTVEKNFSVLGKCLDTTIFSKKELCNIAKVLIYNH